MTPAYTAKLGLVTRKTDIDAQKINSKFLVIYDSINRFFYPEQTWKDLFLWEDFFVSWH